MEEVRVEHLGQEKKKFVKVGAPVSEWVSWGQGLFFRVGKPYSTIWGFKVEQVGGRRRFFS